MVNFIKYEELGMEQKNAVNLNFEKNNLIIGAAGTGKTVIALYRAHELYRRGVKNIYLLMYNRSLQMYVEAVRDTLGWTNEFSVMTVNDFAFYKLFSGSEKNPHSNGIKKIFIPNREGSNYLIDWNKAYDEYKDDDYYFEHIVIDEGQDFPKEFYQFIVKITKYVTVFADPNQSLQEDTCEINEILAPLKRESYYSLTLNYRNSEKLSDWTRKYCYDKSIFAESYRDGEDIEIIDYDKANLHKNIVSIVKKYPPTTNIGIIIPRVDSANEKDKRRFGNNIYDELKEELSSDYNIEIYQNEKTNIEELSRNNVDFTKPSIKIFNYLTVKGLDFDVAILLDNINFYKIKKENKEALNNTIKNMNKLYVAATRAKEKLYVIHMHDENEHLVYKDETVGDVNYSKYPNINELTAKVCLDKALDLKSKNEFGKALYYVHYAISVAGFDDVKDNKEAILLFSFLCDKFNKSDFGLSIVANYSENTGEINDEKLIYFYNLFLINSYNARYLYNTKNNIKNFFKRLTNIKNIEYKETLLERFYDKYKVICTEDEKDIDTAFGIDYIEKYDIKNVKHIYDSFKDSVDNNPKVNVNNVFRKEYNEKIIKDAKNKAKKVGAHLYLNGSKVLVFAESTIKASEYIDYAVNEYGYEEDDFDFYLNYNELKNAELGITKNGTKYVAILVGASPHKHKNLDAFENKPGYPKTFACGYGGNFTLRLFEKGLYEITEYVREKYISSKVYEN